MPAKKVSKIDEKLKAAEARRQALQRAKQDELTQKNAMRKERVVGGSVPVVKTDEKEKGKVFKEQDREHCDKILITSNSGAIDNTVTATTTATATTTVTATDTATATAKKIPKLYDSLGNFISGRYLQISGTERFIEIKKVDKNNNKKKVSSLKLFTVSFFEKLLLRTDNTADLYLEFDLLEIIIEIMKRSVSIRHAIQNKFLILEKELKERRLNFLRQSRDTAMHNHFYFSRKRGLNSRDSMSPIESPKFTTDMNNLVSPGSSMDVLFRDCDGLFTIPTIEEISQRHGLSPSKRPHTNTQCESEVQKINKSIDYAAYENTNCFMYDMDDGFEGDAHLESFNPSSYSTSTTRPTTPSNCIHDENRNENLNKNNFMTVISPFKKQIKDVEADTLYTPQRKSGRTVTDDLECNEDNVTELLLNNPNAAFVTNPYITSYPSMRTPQGKSSLRDRKAEREQEADQNEDQK